MHGPSPSSAQAIPRADASKLHWALYYSERGWLVLPLHTIAEGLCSCGNPDCQRPGEHPRVPSGFKDASNNLEQIRTWWHQWPNANVGIATGAMSGLIAIDILPANRGEVSYAELQKEMPGAFGSLLKVRNGSGSTQLLFECRSPIDSRANIRPGIDVKGDGGFVVAPPSSHISGRRSRFASNSGLVLPPLPQVLHDLIVGGTQADRTDEEQTTIKVDKLPIREEAKELLRKEDEPSNPPANLTSDNKEKPRLLVDTNNPDRTVRAMRDILTTTGELYDRGVPVHLAFDQQQGRCVAQPITPDALQLKVHQVCRPYTLKAKRDGTLYETDVSFPRQMAVMYLDSRAEWRLPPLNGIVAAPLLREDGTIISTIGYDAESGMWCENMPDLRSLVPDHPSKEQAYRALALVRETFRTFCFADSPMVETVEGSSAGIRIVDISKPPGFDESSFLVGCLTAVCRPSLHLAPAVLVRAPSLSGAGTGKGLLARCKCTIAFGHEPHAVTAGATVEELEKRMGAELIQGGPVLFIDNVNDSALKSDQLASVITERPANMRLLGKSQTVRLNSSAFIVVTGNGLTVSEDLARRFITVNLDPHMEDPESRPFPGDIRRETITRRNELLAALLTIWRWGRRNDIPRGVALGSFDQWSRWVRDPLLALGCCDPVTRVNDAKGLDECRQEVADGFAIWWVKHQDQPIAASQLDPQVKDALAPHARSRQDLAARLRMLAGTRLNGFHLTCQKPAGKWGRSTYALKKT